MNNKRPRLVISIDVEDWPQSSWDRSLPVGDYCADNVRRILALIAEHGSFRATFFVLGKFAERHPDVVRDIHAAGHEIACHGYGHKEIFRLTRSAFVDDIARSTELLIDIVGVKPRGYRAPDFSVVGETLWALDVLAEHGYEYDSSIFPINKARYGIPTWPTGPTKVQLDDGRQIVEFPLTTATVRGRRLPISGGGYARLMPRSVLKRAMRSEARARDIPPVFYCHPYEIDPSEFSKMPVEIPLRVRLHQGLGRRGFQRKLSMLFRTFQCISFDLVLDESPDLETVDPGAFRIEAGTIDRPGCF